MFLWRICKLRSLSMIIKKFAFLDGLIYLLLIAWKLAHVAAVLLLLPVVNLDVQLGHLLRQVLPHLLAHTFVSVVAAVTAATASTLVPRAWRLRGFAWWAEHRRWSLFWRHLEVFEDEMLRRDDWFLEPLLELPFGERIKPLFQTLPLKYQNLWSLDFQGLLICAAAAIATAAAWKLCSRVVSGRNCFGNLDHSTTTQRVKSWRWDTLNICHKFFPCWIQSNSAITNSLGPVIFVCYNRGSL